MLERTRVVVRERRGKIEEGFGVLVVTEEKNKEDNKEENADVCKILNRWSERV